MKKISNIKNCLKNIASVLKKEGNSIESIGISDGKMGMAIFLFHYSQFIRDERPKLYAENLIEQINNAVDENTSINYLEGLIGFGIATEYLSSHNFLDINVNDFLEDIDSQFEQLKNHYLYLPIKEIVGQGKYFTARLSNFSNNNNSEIVFSKKQCLSNLVDSMQRPYNYYDQALGTIDLMPDIILLNINKEKAQHFLDYAIYKIETMVYEDIHFKNYPGTFNPLNLSMKLIQASEKLNNKLYMEKALFFLNNYEADFRKYLSVDIGLSFVGFKWSVLYHYLGTKLANTDYLRLSEEWLAYSLKKHNEFVIGEYQNRMPLNQWNGYSQTGLALLYLIGACPEDIFDILPLYML